MQFLLPEAYATASRKFWELVEQDAWQRKVKLEPPRASNIIHGMTSVEKKEQQKDNAAGMRTKERC